MALKALVWSALLWGCVVMAACSSTRHVPAGKYLLDKVEIHVADDTDGEIKTSEMANYLRQTPNHKVLGFAKLQLATYNLSGRDSTKWYNRWIRRIGQPPVIYDSTLTRNSANQLRQAMVNKGYLSAAVEVDTLLNPAKRKAKVIYTIHGGTPHRLASVAYQFDDPTLEPLVMADSSHFTVRPGRLLDRSELDNERALISERLRNRGYYAFGKESVGFIADTVAGSHDVDLTVVLKRPVIRSAGGGLDTLDNHSRYRIRNVYYITAYNPTDRNRESDVRLDTVMYHPGSYMVYGPDHYLTPAILYNKSFLRPGELFSDADVTRTYESLNRLGILKSINIEMRPAGELRTPDSIELMLDAFVMLSRTKKQGVTLEVEGTNSEGDFGFGVGVTYQHRNVSKASNTFTAKMRLNYESLSGNLNGLINDRYTEYAAEFGLTFPKFVFPFISENYKRRVKATSELSLSFNYQERPEYTRIIAGAGWKYKWVTADNKVRRTFDLVDINYVYLPESTQDFINQIAPNNPLLRYSYEDHFIVRMAYTYNITNRRVPATGGVRRLAPQRTVYTLRAAGETGGNLLYAISSLAKLHRSDGMYKIFGIAYSQYVKAEADYAITRNFGQRHALAFHAGMGIGIPYGNSKVLPFEKRFYAGGANGVRGWGVRTLGPGSYDSRNSVSGFINQCGDIRLDLNLEYRAKLFWVIEGALFVDAGNIWTIRNYEAQPGGVFKFSKFWKQIALAYGAGVRLNFTYFIVRMDLGMKAHNPAMGQQRWPLIHPNWHRDATFHFSVGYPF